MASAQVLPNSKQRDLEAGKRRLEEFRKRKAEGRVKKPASTGQLQSAAVSQYEKQTEESQSKRLLDSDGAATSERKNVSSKESPGVVMSDDSQPIDSSKTTELGSSSGSHTSPLSSSNHNAYDADPVQKSTGEQASRWRYDSGRADLGNNHHEEEKNHYPSISNGAQGIYTDEVTTDQSMPPNPTHGLEDSTGIIYQSNYYPMGEGQINEHKSYLKEASRKDYGTSNSFAISISSEKAASFPVAYGDGFASISARGNSSSLNEDSIHSTSNLTETFPKDGKYRHTDGSFGGSMVFGAGERKLTSVANHGLGENSAPWQASDSPFTGSSFNFKDSFNHATQNSTISETGTRRTRPSFLDSLNVSRASASQLSFSQPEKVETVTFGPFQRSRISNPPSILESDSNSVSTSNEGEVLSNDKRTEWKHEFPTTKQDENFAALEQHIEDLTQEKFSLQRALDASRALAESLAAENSSLTDSYNQQGAVVNQLKFDLERLQEEIKAYLQELESVKLEYTNAQLECNAADERAKILASEVIGLEDKALRLRSSELKLEKLLENSNADIASLKKQVNSLKKDREDLQQTIDALKEEKKVMQSKLRKASGSGKFIETIKTPAVMKDASTSVEDLDVDGPNFIQGESSGVDMIKSTQGHEMQDIASSSLSHETREFNLPVASAAIPTDQLRTIGNINSLISELALEKEELMRVLASESSHSSKLKEMNMELSRKLEAQTQRLELLTAQTMANENITMRPTDSHVQQDSISYTDEGDEVVERVLGWIMKLFPGGPSKRRTSKLL